MVSESRLTLVATVRERIFPDPCYFRQVSCQPVDQRQLIGGYFRERHQRERREVSSEAEARSDRLRARAVRDLGRERSGRRRHGLGSVKKRPLTVVDTLSRLTASTSGRTYVEICPCGRGCGDFRRARRAALRPHHGVPPERLLPESGVSAFAPRAGGGEAAHRRGCG